MGSASFGWSVAAKGRDKDVRPPWRALYAKTGRRTSPRAEATRGGNELEIKQASQDSSAGAILENGMNEGGA